MPVILFYKWTPTITAHQNGRRIAILCIGLFIGSMMGCGSGEKDKQKQKFSEDQLVEVNRFLVKKDQQAIRSFVNRQGWKMLTSNTGLWYQRVEEGNGKPVIKGQNISLYYNLTLIDGTPIDHSDSTGLKRFTVGHGGVEAGLEEGILFFREGDSARLILPPHLGYGLMGDEHRIPSRAILVYHFRILNSSEN